MHAAIHDTDKWRGDGSRRSRLAGGVDGGLRLAVAWLGCLRSLVAGCTRENSSNNMSSSSFPGRSCTGWEHHDAAMHEMEGEKGIHGEAVLTGKRAALKNWQRRRRWVATATGERWWRWCGLGDERLRPESTKQMLDAAEWTNGAGQRKAPACRDGVPEMKQGHANGSTRRRRRSSWRRGRGCRGRP